MSRFSNLNKLRYSFLILAAAIGLGCHRSALAAERQPLPSFERIVIDDKFPGAYQVEVADVNGDGKPDIVALGGGTCAWYENPTWKKRIVTNPKQTPGIISTATADLDGDGRAEIAIAYEFDMNEPTKGKLLLAHPGKELDDPWMLVPVAEVGSIHRIRWAKQALPQIKYQSPKDPTTVAHLKWTELVVAPIFGPSAKPPRFQDEPAHIAIFKVRMPGNESEVQRLDRLRGGTLGGGGTIGGGDRKPSKPEAGKTSPGQAQKPDQKPELFEHGEVIDHAPVIHAIEIVDFNGDPQGDGLKVPAILAASNLGITANSIFAIAGAIVRKTTTLTPGAPGEAPKRGASEIHAGRFKDGFRFLATVEPWHGTDVVIYKATSNPPSGVPKFGPRNVIDSSLKDGHALWVADVDGDGDDEVFAGYRGQGTSLIGYDFDGENWNRTVIDTAIAAQDLRGGDIDGDGTPDFVGVGGSTHNVVWYRTKKP